MTDTTPKKNILLGSKIFTIENFFSADECKQLVLLAEKKGFKDSSPSGGGHGRTGREDARTSQFVVLPDEKKMSAELYSRIQPFVGKDLSGLSFSAYLPFQEDAEKWTPVRWRTISSTNLFIVFDLFERSFRLPRWRNRILDQS